MDSKTRHELEQNELAKWITHQYEDWIQPNKSWLGYAVLGLIAVIAILFATSWLNTQNRSAEWKDFYTAFNAEDSAAALELVANSFCSNSWRVLLSIFRSPVCKLRDCESNK